MPTTIRRRLLTLIAATALAAPAIAATALAATTAALIATPAAALTPVPAAPHIATPPAATVYQPYHHQVTDLGVPAATQITVYRDSGSGPTPLPPAATYLLNNGLTFDTATGTIDRNLTATDSTNTNPDRYTIVINNGIGGETTALPATATTPALAQHDVMVQFRIPVRFSDVPATHQFAAQIYRMADAGTVIGYANGTFLPAANVSRQAFASFAVKYLNASGATFAPFDLTTPLKAGSCAAHSATSDFVDVSDTSPFCMEIKQLAIIGVTTGYNPFTFEPGRTITRQAISAMLYRMHLVAQDFTDPAQISAPAACSGPSGFKDVSTANPFCGQIQWMSQNSISTGYTGGSYRPRASSTRQATIAFIDRVGAVDGLTGFGS